MTEDIESGQVEAEYLRCTPPSGDQPLPSRVFQLILLETVNNVDSSGESPFVRIS